MTRVLQLITAGCLAFALTFSAAAQDKKHDKQGEGKTPREIVRERKNDSGRGGNNGNQGGRDNNDRGNRGGDRGGKDRNGNRPNDL